MAATLDLTVLGDSIEILLPVDAAQLEVEALRLDGPTWDGLVGIASAPGELRGDLLGVLGADGRHDFDVRGLERVWLRVVQTGAGRVRAAWRASHRGPAGRAGSITAIRAGLDLQATGLRLAADVRGLARATVQLVRQTGTIDAPFTLTLKRSLDGLAFVGLESAVTLTAEGMTAAVDCRGFAWLGADVTSGSTSAATGRIAVCGEAE